MRVNPTHNLHHKVCKLQVFYVDANAAVLMHLISMVETHLLASCIMEPVAWDLLHIFVNCHVWNRHIRKLTCEFMMTLLVETVFSMSFMQKCTVLQWDTHYKCRWCTETWQSLSYATSTGESLSEPKFHMISKPVGSDMILVRYL